MFYENDHFENYIGDSIAIDSDAHASIARAFDDTKTNKLVVIMI